MDKIKTVCWESWNHWYKYTSLVFVSLFAIMFFVLFSELGEEKPFVALDGSAYEGRQGAWNKDGILIVSAGDKCNISNHRVDVVGETVWRRLDILGENINGFKGTATYEPGECRNDLTFQNILPEEIESGIWEFTGIETAFYGSKSHTITWRTEPFEVE